MGKVVKWCVLNCWLYRCETGRPSGVGWTGGRSDCGITDGLVLLLEVESGHFTLHCVCCALSEYQLPQLQYVVMADSDGEEFYECDDTDEGLFRMPR